MKRFLPFIFFVGLLCFGVGEVFAQCACLQSRKDITASKELKLADVVFVGEVIEIRQTIPDKQNRYTETVTFKVKTAWKQEVEEFITITNEIYGCINGFDEKEEWLVYAYKSQNNKFRTACCCSRTKPLSKATEDLKEFEQNGDKATHVTKKQNQN